MVEYWTDAGSTERSQLALTASTLYNWEELIDASALKDGVHTFNARFRDDNGVWTVVESNFFIVSQGTAMPIETDNRIDGYRIWFAAEPDFVDSFKVEATNPVAEVTEEMPLTYLPKGKYQIAYQFRDLRGVWSPVITDSITKTDNALFTFTADKREIFEGDKVVFTPEFTQFIDSIVWSFGDGFTEVSFTPEHQYDSVGEYDVTASVWHKGSNEGVDYVEIKYITSLSTGIATPQVGTLKMYPVPVDDKLTIESPDVSMKRIRVFALNGTLMKEDECGNPAKTVISFGGFRQGHYVISIETDKGVLSRKITKR